jgi:carboxylesterase type B
MLRNLILPVIALVFALFGSAGATNDNVRVEGGLISVSAFDELRIYEGIPFPAPPTGELRWKAPQPVAAWDGVRKCGDLGPDRLQSPYPPSSLYFPANPNSEYLGSHHAGQIVYASNNLNRQNLLLQEADYKLAEMTPNYVVNFATTGDPGGRGLPKWTPYHFETEDYLDFCNAVQFRNHLLKAQLDFIEQFTNPRASREPRLD